MAVVGGGVTCETIVVSDGLVWRESKEEAMTITGGADFCKRGSYQRVGTFVGKVYKRFHVFRG